METTYELDVRDIGDGAYKEFSLYAGDARVAHLIVDSDDDVDATDLIALRAVRIWR